MDEKQTGRRLLVCREFQAVPVDRPGDVPGTPMPHEDELPCLQMPLLPEGIFEHEWYGLLRWTQEVFAEMVLNFRRQATGFCPSLNFDHRTGPAAGWLVDLVPVPGQGLDQIVAMTPRGQKAIDECEYRYISAEVSDTYTNSLGQNFANVIFGSALTNTPWHDSMRALFGREHMDVPRNSRMLEFAGRRYWVAGLDTDAAHAAKEPERPAETIRQAIDRLTAGG